MSNNINLLKVSNVDQAFSQLMERLYGELKRNYLIDEVYILSFGDAIPKFGNKLLLSEQELHVPIGSINFFDPKSTITHYEKEYLYEAVSNAVSDFINSKIDHGSLFGKIEDFKGSVTVLIEGVSIVQMIDEKPILTFKMNCHME